MEELKDGRFREFRKFDVKSKYTETKMKIKIYTLKILVN